MIVGDVVDLECAGRGVAQHHVAPASAADRREAGHLPFEPDGSDESGASDLIVGDIVDLEPAGRGVAHDHVGFARHAAEIADADDLPIEPDSPD